MCSLIQDRRGKPTCLPIVGGHAGPPLQNAGGTPAFPGADKGLRGFQKNSKTSEVLIHPPVCSLIQDRRGKPTCLARSGGHAGPPLRNAGGTPALPGADKDLRGFQKNLETSEVLIHPPVCSLIQDRRGKPTCLARSGGHAGPPLRNAGGTPALPGADKDLRGFQKNLETSEVFNCMRDGQTGPPLQPEKVFLPPGNASGRCGPAPNGVNIPDRSTVSAPAPVTPRRKKSPFSIHFQSERLTSPSGFTKSVSGRV